MKGFKYQITLTFTLSKQHLKNFLTKLENYFKQIAVPIKIYAYFECNLEKFHTNERGNGTSYTEKKSKSYYM